MKDKIPSSSRGASSETTRLGAFPFILEIFFLMCFSICKMKEESVPVLKDTSLWSPLPRQRLGSQHSSFIAFIVP